MQQKSLFLALGLILLGGYFMKTGSPKGIRNNNPLNIEKGEDWIGMVGDDGRFVIFETVEHGLRAAGRILRTYAFRHGRTTINGIISRWAPPSENKTQNYINFVSKRAGIPSDRPLAQAEYPKVMEAMIMMENGEQPYSMETIQRGFDWGFNG
ncbi:hypothetical protein [Pseudoalteromonas maricaloris]|uniref:hypothetical protein n=1 Tax=Pseudoalteromonas maricaloris TaxID=184924 RepID=UPI000299FE63|nr:hypothetical protein [Pseudoalteromonas flavipulchra]